MVWAAAYSQGYSSSESLPAGTLVSLNYQTPGSVTPANSDINNEPLGVVVSSSVASVSNQSSQVQVSTSGVVNVLASNINGAINRGDKIAASPISGVGMRNSQSGEIAGTAQSDLTSSSPDAQMMTVKNKSGVSKQILVGLVSIDINVSYYQVPVMAQPTYIPQFIRNISDNLTGKTVSNLRILASLGVLLITLICVITIIYTAVRTGIGSIGRNPLAKSSIQRGITKVIVLSIIVLIAACAGAYMILGA
jgi:hypothetical protein